MLTYKQYVFKTQTTSFIIYGQLPNKRSLMMGVILHYKQHTMERMYEGYKQFSLEDFA